MAESYNQGLEYYTCTFFDPPFSIHLHIRLPPRPEPVHLIIVLFIGLAIIVVVIHGVLVIPLAIIHAMISKDTQRLRHGQLMLPLR
jgi:hypothetical protein